MTMGRTGLKPLPTGRTFEVDRAENGWVLRVYLNPLGTSQTYICDTTAALLGRIEATIGEQRARAEQPAPDAAKGAP